MGISPEQWDRVKDLYEAALEYDPSQRADFLQRNINDEVARHEVRRLLAEHDNVGSFLSTPPYVDIGFLPGNPKNDLQQEKFWPSGSAS